MGDEDKSILIVYKLKILFISFLVFESKYHGGILSNVVEYIFENGAR